MKNKLLIVLLTSLLSSQVSAGVPVIEETSVIFQPLQYMEMLQTQLNTINQYEQMILDYENQIRQLENLVLNTNFENIRITNLQDLQNTLNRLRSTYTGAIEQYNSVANRSNKLMEDGCDFLNKYELCAKEQKEILNSLQNEITERNKKNKEDNDPNNPNSLASQITQDQQDLKDFSTKLSNNVGTNQILSDTRELNRLTAKSLIDLRQQTLEMKSTQNELLNYFNQKELTRQKRLETYRKNLTKWKTNKVYQDHY